MTKKKCEGGMGFRDLLCFNKALAKTAWRLLIIQMIYGARFSRGSISLNVNSKAKKGRRASWGWSSLLEGRDLLLNELGWKVGDGRRIHVWGDKWILGLDVCKLQAGATTEQEEKMTVADLIEDGRWNLRCIEGRISQLEKELILKTHIYVGHRVDSYMDGK